jgi:hypothetical protein
MSEVFVDRSKEIRQNADSIPALFDMSPGERRKFEYGGVPLEIQMNPQSDVLDLTRSVDVVQRLISIFDDGEIVVKGSTHFHVGKKTHDSAGVETITPLLQYYARTLIKRHYGMDSSQHVAALSKIGLAVYEGMLKQISVAATQCGRSITHMVVHEPTQGMSLDDWENKFRPFLSTHKYKEIDPGFWTKTYVCDSAASQEL